MIQDKPYFMSNEEWWFYDWEEMKYKLTDKAPEKAIQSYNEFYSYETEYYDII